MIWTDTEVDRLTEAWEGSRRSMLRAIRVLSVALVVVSVALLFVTWLNWAIG